MLRFLCLLIAFTPLFTQAQDPRLGPTQIELQRLIQDQALKYGEMSFVAVNLDNSRVIAEHNTYRAMIPASLQKLFTTGIALETLGPDFTFDTRIAYTGEVINGTLQGNLIFYGAGDPTMQSRFFSQYDRAKEIKDALAKAGIKTIEGSLVFDLTTYSEHNTPSGWSWEDLGNYFGATPTAFMWEDNMITVGLRSGQVGSEVVLSEPWPADSRYEVDLSITAADNNKDNAWFFSAPRSTIIYGKGTIPAHQSRFEVKISNPDPVKSFGEYLVDNWDIGAPKIQLNYVEIPYANTQDLITISSPPLKDLITVTNQHSVNLFAEAINLALDTADQFKSVKGGLETQKNFYKKQKIRTPGMRQLDGSGISPMNRVTAETMIDHLRVMYHSSNFEPFYNSLAVGGESGTLKYYFKEGKAKGNMHGKSGTMKGVRNYAGYVKNKYGETVAFCLMMNDYNEDQKSQVMNKVERLMEAVIVD